MADSEEEINNELLEVKAQLNLDEKHLLYQLAKNIKGAGEIVDAGAFLGGSAAVFGYGIRDNSNLEPSQKLGRIHSFDHFKYGKWIKDQWIPEGTFEQDETFIHIYHEAIRDLQEYVTIHPSDIKRAGWRFGRIEILFLDVCKTPLVNDAAMQIFLPHLQPGDTIVQQDYSCPGCNIWIYASMEAFIDKLELRQVCRRNSVAWTLKDPITPAEIDAAMTAVMSHDQRCTLALQASERWSEGSFQKEIILSSIESYKEDLDRRIYRL